MQMRLGSLLAGSVAALALLFLSPDANGAKGLNDPGGDTVDFTASGTLTDTDSADSATATGITADTATVETVTVNTKTLDTSSYTTGKSDTGDLTVTFTETKVTRSDTVDVTGTVTATERDTVTATLSFTNTRG